ncbi:hypothetical protein B296_00011043 [Ensete ventricosum]|uniref:Uncharacterized protein n=1 Tax=Ensete ventricosum TaxID=4639 RepID=A0A427AFQ1_ENSVE|nr:hypothetical protein B296_00011043 [Ensete ventricosum]
MVLKTKGVSRHMHLILKKHLTEGLRYDQSGWRVGFLQCLYLLRELDKSEDKVDVGREMGHKGGECRGKL